MYCLCRPSKTITLRIILLDENDFLQDVQDNLPGQAILDTIFSRLNLIETAYFGARFVDEDGQTHWLDPTVRISRQLKGTKDPFELYFGVKFYAADPCKLIEEITRYQLYLQVKQDVLQGRLPVAFELAAELGAYVVQAELGDYDPRKHAYGYVSEFRLLSNQTRDLEQRICELHQQLKGINPSQAELNYLDKVKWNDMYGVDLHPVLGEDSVEYFLGLTPSGIVVLRNKTTVAHYYWPRIAKVYFKGRYFMLRVCDKNNEVSTYGFETPRKSACKHLWKCCVEHHAFFRLVRVSPMQPQASAGDLFALGSRFRYSGRTEKQAVKDAIAMGRNQPSFKRTPSRRQARRMLEESGMAEKQFDKLRPEIKSISIPQPAENFESPYRSTCSIPASLSLRHNNNHSMNNNNNNNNEYARPSFRAPDSPRSTKSAPWMRSQQRGLFGITSSPKSVRSASALGGNNSSTHRLRSSSVESRSSVDSKSGKRHRRKSRRTSDNESELSRDSTRSGRSHNSHRKHRRHRSKHRHNDSASDHHLSGSHSVELVDSNHQWREVQRRQVEVSSKSVVQQASVMKSNQIASSHGSSDYHTHRSRKHRSKHRSPTDRGTKAWSNELARHLQFDLVDTTGMSEDQLREIPYTVVETAHAAKRSNFNSLKVHKTSQNVDRVDRIRSICSNDVDQSGQVVDGSIRSASTLSSSRDYDRNSGLVRMMSSLSMGDFISPSTSSLSPLDSNGLRVSHEHTDSGLGADQDYAYSSERSSDSAKYGTNKSSGASVTSGGGSGGNRSLNNNTAHHHIKSNPYASATGLQNHYSVSSRNRKPPMCPMARHQQPSKNNAVPAVHNFTTTTSSLNNNNYNNSIHNNNQYSHNNNNNHSSSHSYSAAATSTTNTLHSQSNNNNLLQNNLVFQNNRYTFSLNRLNGPLPIGPAGHCSGGGGFASTVNTVALPTIPSTSVYGDGSYIKTTRGTKSDIGVSVRKKSSCHKHTHKSHSHSHHDRYNHHFDANSNSKSSGFKSAYCISGKPTIQSTDYLENYKAATQYLYLQQQQQQQQIEQAVTDGYVDEHGQNNFVYYKDYHQKIEHGSLQVTQSPGSAVPVTGPLVYLDLEMQQQQQQSSSVGKPEDKPENKNACSDGLSGLSSMENILHKRNTTTTTSVSTTASAIEHSNQLQTHRSSSLELILTPIMQSRRVQ